jgi:hypothetical protein
MLSSEFSVVSCQLSVVSVGRSICATTLDNDNEDDYSHRQDEAPILALMGQIGHLEDRFANRHIAYADTPIRRPPIRFPYALWTLAATFSRSAFKAMKPVASDWL